jgi:phenylacetic acid degradation operon negative regulatory protein
MAISSAPLGKKLLLMNFGTDFDRYNVNMNFHRLCKKGFIHQFKQKNNIFFNIMPDKRYDVLGNFTALKMDKAKQAWDGKWRLIIYDIPEKKRTQREFLRSLLQLLGFGKIQYSCWVSAYDYSKLIYDACKKRGIEQCICLYEGKFFAGKNIDELVESAWNLEETKANYETVSESCAALAEDVSRNRRPLKEIYKDYVQVYNLFKETAANDPFLPQQFLLDWPYKKAEEELKNFSLTALKKANRIL